MIPLQHFTIRATDEEIILKSKLNHDIFDVFDCLNFVLLYETGIKILLLN